MEIIRKVPIDVNVKDICVGDQITFELTDLGIFTATAQKVTKGGVWFLFDSIVCRKSMNDTPTNEGGYKKSKLKKWIDTELKSAFPKDMQKHIKKLGIPSYGKIFGHDNDVYDNFISDKDEQYPLMKDIKNRIATIDNDTHWYWLSNATKKIVSSTYFAIVDDYGCANYGSASNSGGVRPEFLLVK